MSPEEGEVYLMREGDDDEWVTPTPADTAVRDAVAAATDLDADDLADLTDYVDADEIRTVLKGEDGEVSFAVEDHDVTIAADGSIDVA